MRAAVRLWCGTSRRARVRTRCGTTRPSRPPRSSRWLARAHHDRRTYDEHPALGAAAADAGVLRTASRGRRHRRVQSGRTTAHGRFRYQRVLEWTVGASSGPREVFELKSEPTWLRLVHPQALVGGGRGGDVTVRLARGAAVSRVDLNQTGAVLAADVSPESRVAGRLRRRREGERVELENRRTCGPAPPARRSGGDRALRPRQHVVCGRNDSALICTSCFPMNARPMCSGMSPRC